MAGTGNILLKRGITIPTDAALPRGMPATQLIASSPTANTGGLAYVNYPNRLWMGMDGSLAPNADGCTGNTQFNWSHVEAGSGTAVAVGIGQTISCAGADVTINNTVRSGWVLKFELSRHLMILLVLAQRRSLRQIGAIHLIMFL